MEKSISEKGNKIGISVFIMGVIVLGIIFGITYYIDNSDITNFEVQINPDNGLVIKIDKEKEAPTK